MSEHINEKINVVAVYNRNIKPHSFFPWRIKWQGREYLLKKITFWRKEKQGRDTVHVFYATDGSIDFCLEFNAELLTWTLKQIEDGTPIQ